VDVGKLKKGQQLVRQGINLPGQAATYMLPLADLPKRTTGPPLTRRSSTKTRRSCRTSCRRRKSAHAPAGKPAGRADEVSCQLT
jgi:hypothetical protein